MEETILGREKQIILDELYRRFKYNGEYWIPLKTVTIDKNYLVVSDEDALKYQSKIEAFIKAESKAFYLTGEAGYLEPRSKHKWFPKKSKWVQKVDYLDMTYGPVEFVYFDSDFEWLIYISHENTVTFCGEKLINFINTIFNGRKP